MLRTWVAYLTRENAMCDTAFESFRRRRRQPYIRVYQPDQLLGHALQQGNGKSSWCVRTLTDTATPAWILAWYRLLVRVFS